MKSSLLAIGFILACMWLSFEMYRVSKPNPKSKIGTQIVLYSDTLIIVDYSLLNENYTLSNNNKVSFELIEALPVIK